MSAKSFPEDWSADVKPDEASLPPDPFGEIRVIVVRVPVPDPALKVTLAILSMCLGWLIGDIIFGRNHG